MTNDAIQREKTARKAPRQRRNAKQRRGEKERKEKNESAIICCAAPCLCPRSLVLFLCIPFRVLPLCAYPSLHNLECVFLSSYSALRLFLLFRILLQGSNILSVGQLFVSVSSANNQNGRFSFVSLLARNVHTALRSALPPWHTHLLHAFSILFFCHRLLCLGPAVCRTRKMAGFP